MRRRIAMVILLLLTAAPSPAHAADNDYLPFNTAWNGLSGLDAMARAKGTRIQLLNELAWDRLPAGASLIIIHPQAELQMARVKPFVERGGRLLVADDFGLPGRC